MSISNWGKITKEITKYTFDQMEMMKDIKNLIPPKVVTLHFS